MTQRGEEKILWKIIKLYMNNCHLLDEVPQEIKDATA